jgi:hypothetical protein
MSLTRSGMMMQMKCNKEFQIIKLQWCVYNVYR